MCGSPPPPPPLVVGAGEGEADGEADGASVARTPEQRAEYEERRIQQRVRRRDEVEFPREIEEYRRAWEPLGILSEARLSATLDGTEFQLEVDLVLEGAPSAPSRGRPR